jgi:hypothetical protein
MLQGAHSRQTIVSFEQTVFCGRDAPFVKEDGTAGKIPWQALAGNANGEASHPFRNSKNIESGKRENLDMHPKVRHF